MTQKNSIYAVSFPTARQKSTQNTRELAYVKMEIPVKVSEGSSSASECKLEILVFLRGAEGGVKRLKDVLPSLFAYYNIITIESKARLLSECGLIPYKCKDAIGDVTFYFDGSDVQDQFKPPHSVCEAWIKLDAKPLAETPAPVLETPASEPEQNSPQVAPETPESAHDSQPATPVPGHHSPEEIAKASQPSTSSPMCCE